MDLNEADAYYLAKCNESTEPGEEYANKICNILTPRTDHLLDLYSHLPEVKRLRGEEIPPEEPRKRVKRKMKPVTTQSEDEDSHERRATQK